MGVALRDIFQKEYSVIGKNSKDFDARDFHQVRGLIEKIGPDIVINTVVFMGIDACEKEPEKTLIINSLYPKLLAELSNQMGFLFVHFSTDAVFNAQKRDFYTEIDTPRPLNLYGLTKYGADCFVQAIAKHFYLFRVSLLFGETTKKTQFVEKILQQVKEGHKRLRIADDIVFSPTYSKDAALEVRRIIEDSFPFGLYHIANEGKSSLYDLIKEIFDNLDLEIDVDRASYTDFPFLGIKNIFTPLKSEKLDCLRPWKEAVKEYCTKIKRDL